MKTRRHFLPLFLCGALFAGCQSEPTAIDARSLEPAFDATAASQPVGPVTIQTILDFSALPFHGTFTVVQGATELGCSGGTFVDHFASVDNPGSGVPRSSSVHKDFACTTGGSGTFIVNFTPTAKPGPGDFNGHWNVLSGSGDFANLRGEGDYSVITVDPPIAHETLTGSIHSNP